MAEKSKKEKTGKNPKDSKAVKETGEPRKDYSQTRVSYFEVVFPSMVNHYQTLFGGVAMQWMDRAAWLCSVRYARQEMVTVASDRIEFKKPVRQGDIVEMRATVLKVGRTSITVRVEMYRENPLSGQRELATEGEFVMVAVDRNGKASEVRVGL